MLNSPGICPGPLGPGWGAREDALRRSQLQPWEHFTSFAVSISWHEALRSVCPRFSLSSIFLHWFYFFSFVTERQRHLIAK